MHLVLVYLPLSGTKKNISKKKLKVRVSVFSFFLIV